jgi:amino acid transporter
MILTRAIAIACLTVFAWLVWVASGLFAILFLMSLNGGDPPLKLGYLGVFTVGALLTGFVCRHLARRIEAAGT